MSLKNSTTLMGATLLFMCCMMQNATAAQAPRVVLLSNLENDSMTDKVIEALEEISPVRRDGGMVSKGRRGQSGELSGVWGF